MDSGSGAGMTEGGEGEGTEIDNRSLLFRG